ncbi:hypothetical protein NECAME_13722 [Necator americanus]|uniref:Secreted protein n=1 Tax=Necator americanus TaxID=51031 RepID=W2SVR6_NECAM|nr:hypothetical protein NECAME_13722 [Necator americanus]ETN72772.1 hypothetical protein NECAME_13722 [Necator americanus]
MDVGDIFSVFLVRMALFKLNLSVCMTLGNLKNSSQRENRVPRRSMAASAVHSTRIRLVCGDCATF